MNLLPIKKAVLSVSDKSGLIELAKALRQRGVEIISTGGTARLLQEKKFPVTPISKITGNLKDDYFDGRMKTISFNYESALLYKRSNAQHKTQAEELGIPQIDLVVCNLYPFEEVIKKPNITVEDAIENIDIGGPCMIRAAAKNYEGIAVVVDPAQYSEIVKELEKNKGSISLEMRQRLMVRAYEKAADYDAAVHTFFGKRFADQNIKRLKYMDGIQLGRYAENWHQKGWLYKSVPNGATQKELLPDKCRGRSVGTIVPNIPRAKQVHGGPLGYNNYLDAEAALQSVLELKDSVAVSVIKHANPCGYATGETLLEAFERAWQGDPVSAFGSVIALTRPLDLDVAKLLGERFIEVVIAPGFNEDALQYIKGLGKKKAGLRLLEYTPQARTATAGRTVLRFITGGLLEQENDDRFYLADSIKELFKPPFKARCPNSGKEFTLGMVTKNKISDQRAGLYEFGLYHVKHVKSNAIIIAREYRAGYYQVLGMGCGQPNRKDSVVLAGQRARDNLAREFSAQGGPASGGKDKSKAGSQEQYLTQQLQRDNVVLVSDAFFPFRDGIDNIAQTGVRYVIQPGGSVKDDEVIKTADEYKMGMLFTGVRKFYH